MSNGHSQKDRKLVFKTNYSLMQVKSISEILLSFIKLPFVIKMFCLFLSGCLHRFYCIMLFTNFFFQNSLQILMERMTSASPIFVRCLKPNHVKSPGNFDQKYIQEQVLLSTLCILMDSSFWSVTVKMEWSILNI